MDDIFFCIFAGILTNFQQTRLSVKKIFILFALLTGCFSVFGQISFPDARTCVQTSRYDIFSPFGNPATLSYMQKFEVSAFFQNRYAEKELSTAGGHLAVGTKPVNIAAAFVQYGFLDYHEQLFTFGLARKIGKRFALSVQADYYNVHYSSLSGADGKFIIQLGFVANPAKNLYIGFHTFNPAQTKLRTGGIELDIPSLFAVGMSYWFNPKIVTSIMCEKDIFRQFRFAVEADYAIYENFRVKAACLKEGEVMPALGCGMALKGVALDANFKIHTKLGVIPEIALTYALK